MEAEANPESGLWQEAQLGVLPLDRICRLNKVSPNKIPSLLIGLLPGEGIDD